MEPSRLDALVDAARRHDTEALAALCEHFYRRVYRFILYRVRRAEDAEDLASEVCLRMVAALPKQRGSITAWVFRIARNLVIDAYRRGAVRQEVAWSVERMEAEPGSGAIGDQPILPHQLERALGRLTPEQQEVVQLRFVEGLSASEIGEIQGRATGAVRALQFRALVTLRKALATPEEE